MRVRVGMRMKMGMRLRMRIKNEDEDTAVPRPQLPTLTNLLRTYRQRSMAIIDDAEERMMQMAIEESLR